jgi:DNA-binding transcriptional LysR family regulator
VLDAFRGRYPGIAVSIVEGVPSRLSALLLEGKLDIALMAQPQPFGEPLLAQPMYRERFGLAFSAGHRFAARNVLHLSDVEGEPYLSRINCEYRGHISGLCDDRGIVISSANRSEREDWIMAMVAAGMGVCFAPEFSVTQPGVCHRPVTDPEVVREVSLVSVAGRIVSPAISAFTEAVHTYDWGAGTTH